MTFNNSIISLAVITVKSIVRDNILRAILSLSLLYFAIPFLSLFSMRQVTELNVNISLGLTSLILLLLALSLGGTTLWKELDRKYVYTVLGLPISRCSYILGKFFGVCAFLTLVTVVLGTASLLSIQFSLLSTHPVHDLSINLILLSFLYDVLKFSLLVSISYLVSTLSTSFLLPIFGTIGIYLAGNFTQEVYDYLLTDNGQSTSQLIQYIVKCSYYIIPNFEYFDIKTNVIYNIPIELNTIFTTIGYAVVYTAIMLSLSIHRFNRREFL